MKTSTHVEGVSTAASIRPANLFLVAVWFALVTGGVESSILLFRRYILDRFIWTNIHVVWMTPLSYLMYFSFLTLVLWLIARRWPNKVSPGLLIFTLTSISAISLSLLLLKGRLHHAALIILALGLSAQIARWGAARADKFFRMVRRTTPALTGLTAAVASVALAWYPVSEMRQLARLTPANAGAVNVIFIILDTVRAANLSLYGYPLPTTPNLERWAKRGVVFDRAITPAPWTLPSHASMFTGRWPHELSATFEKPLDGTFPTLAEAFRNEGYLTGALSANFFYTTRESGLARGFAHFRRRPISIVQTILSSELSQTIYNIVSNKNSEERVSDRKTADEISSDVVDWVGKAGKRPFFLFVNYFDAHLPYDPPREFRSLIESINGAAAGNKQLASHVDYDASIAYLDDRLGRLLDGLERSGALENTMVIITADHGELLGEHGLIGHTRGLYLPLIWVPLVVLPPGEPGQGIRVPTPVTLREIPATIADLAHVGDGRFPGLSLRRYWDSEQKQQQNSDVLTEYGPGGIKSVIVEDWHYILARSGKEMVFHLPTDPHEKADLAGTSQGQQILPQLRRARDGLLHSDARFKRSLTGNE